MAHCVGMKLTHLREDGGFLVAENVDSGGSGGNQGSGTQRDADAGRYGPRKLRPTKLDPYKDYLLGRIEAAAALRFRQWYCTGDQGTGIRGWNHATQTLHRNET